MKKTSILSLITLLVVLLFFNFGCSKEDNYKYPDVTATADTIIGELKYIHSVTSETPVLDWPFGKATLNAFVGNNEILTSAEVDSAGNFMMILPGVVPGAYMSSLAELGTRYGGTVVATPVTIRFIPSITYKVSYKNNGLQDTLVIKLCTLNPDLSVDELFTYNFCDMDGTLAGTCQDGSTFNWAFTKGWKMVETYFINGTSGAFNSQSISAIPANAVWVNN